MRKFRESASAICQLQLRPTRQVKNAFRAYETSWETERLESERNRRIYCELIDLGRREKSENVSENSDVKITRIADKTAVDDNDSDEESPAAAVDDEPKWWTEFSVEARRPNALAKISVQQVAKAYKKGSIDDRIWCQDGVEFGLNADVNLPASDLLQLDVKETFFRWKIFHVHTNSYRMERSGSDWWRRKFTMSLSCKSFKETQRRIGRKSGWS